MTKLQIKILKYINKNPRTLKEIDNKFKFKTPNDRLSVIDFDFSKLLSCKVDKINKTKIFYLNSSGKETLESVNNNTLNFWFSILIPLLGTLIINYILQLLPQLQESIASFLSKIFS